MGQHMFCIVSGFHANNDKFNASFTSVEQGKQVYADNR